MLPKLTPLLVVLLVSVSLSFERMHRSAAEWTPDGYIYLRMALIDRGLTEPDAQRAANLFIRSTDEGRSHPSFYSANSPQFFVQQRQLFRSRPLYPFLASLLPLPAPLALKVVSAVAFALVPIVVFSLLSTAGEPWIAALGALGIAFLPVVRSVAGLALTDELALLFWVATIAALLTYMQRPAATTMAALILASAGLTFTRPAIHLAIGATLAPLVIRTYASMRPRIFAALVALLGVAVAFAVYSSFVHGPGPIQELRFDFTWQQAVHGPFTGSTFAHWWTRSLLQTLVAMPAELISALGYFTIILAAAALLLYRHSVIAPVSIGALTVALVAALADPFEFDIPRTVVLPMTPIVVMLATLSLFVLVEIVRGRFSTSATPLNTGPKARRSRLQLPAR